MPLATLSRILSSKSSVATRQLPSEETPSQTIYHTPERSPKSPRFYSRKRKDGAASSKSSPAKVPRTFAFSFDPLNVFGSFRTRPKLEMATTHSGSRTLYSHSSYLGYEDQEYGEPEAEAEEIRRPSGLGRRASIGEETMDLTDPPSSIHGKYEGQVPPKGDDDVFPVPQGRDTASVTSHESDLEELAEIRYPSGLGDIKPATLFFNADRPLSTYPIFERNSSFEGGNISEPSETPAALSLRLFDLSTVVPLLAPYLPRQTLLALTLVDKAVTDPATRLLWNEISLEATIYFSGKNVEISGQKSLILLGVLSSRPELACLVRSLKLDCRTDFSTPGPSPPRRPQPLSLSSDSPPFSNLERITSQPTNPRSAPISLDTDHQSIDAQTTHGTPSKSIDKDRSVSKKLRRASSLLPSGINLNISFPDAFQIPAPKLPRPNVQLTHPRSMMKRRSVALMGQSTSQASSRPHSLKVANDDAEWPSPSKGLPGDSTWTPPSEWEWTPSTNSHRYSSVPSPGESISPSISPSQLTGSNTPHEWNAMPLRSYDLERRSRPQSSLQSLRTGVQATGSLTPNPELKLSPSLPSLTALRFPNTPSLSINPTSEDSSVSPVTAPASPVTPYSSVSLSAFPLPPATPPSVPPLPLEFLPSSPQDLKSHHQPLPSPPMPGPKFNNGVTKPFALASVDLTHLSHATLSFVSTPPSVGSISEDFNLQSGHHRECDENLDIATFEILREFLMNLKSLRSLKVVCTPAREAFHRAQWTELIGVEVEVVCAS